MAITGFIPEIWSAQLLSSLKKATIFAGPGIVNRSYEGEIAEVGDSVRITSISRPSVAEYVKNSTTVTPETLTDAQRVLTIDQSYYFAFEVDDIDLRQVKSGGALMAEAAQEAAYALADTADQYVEGLFAGADTDNELGAIQCTTSDKAVAMLISLMTKLDEKNVPRAGRFCIVPPWVHAKLVGADEFISVSASGSDEALRNGMVGRCFGFDILMSNNCSLVTGDDYRVCAGYPGAITYAEQINNVEAYRPENSFSDALKGLHLYGAKVIRPEGIATAEASVT